MSDIFDKVAKEIDHTRPSEQRRLAELLRTHFGPVVAAKDEEIARLRKAKAIVDSAYGEAAPWQQDGPIWKERAESAEAERDRLREALMWQPIKTAPKTGEHILGASFEGNGFGICGGKKQSYFVVVHWWSNPGEEGWYASTGSDSPLALTHWLPLPEKGSDDV